MSWSFKQDMPRLHDAMNSAPSIFNQRPWELQAVADDRAELYCTPNPILGNRLPREVVISCGAALYNLRLAIQVAGRNPSVWLLPGLDRGSGLLSTVTAGRTLLASLEVTPSRPARPTDAEQELYEAMWLRRSDRGPYRYMRVPSAILVEMEVAAAREHGWLRTLPRAEVRQVLRAAARASRELGNELSGLSNVPLGAYGPTPQDGEEPPTRRDFWLPAEVARFERHPQLMALSTDDDRPLDWLRAGEALERALLTGTRYSMSATGGRSVGYRTRWQYGPLDPHRLLPRPPVPAGYAVEASFLTQALELADLQGRRRTWPWRTNYTEIPQAVIRVGYAPLAAGTAPDRTVFLPLVPSSPEAG